MEQPFRYFFHVSLFWIFVSNWLENLQSIFHIISQIAGLTNNSRLSEAHEVRHCVQKYRNLGEPVLQVAKVASYYTCSSSSQWTYKLSRCYKLVLILQRRLDSMLYVGLTEEHRESASLFANVVGSQVLSQVVASNLTAKNKNTKSGWCKFLNLSILFCLIRT